MNIKLLALSVLLLTSYNLCAQDKLLSAYLPNGTTNISGDITDPDSGYKLTYYNMKYLQDVDGNSYYQFNSGMGSYVKIESPNGEYFQAGDEIKIDTYVNRSNGDNKLISIYNQADYANGTLLGTVSALGGYIAGVYSIVLPTNLPDNTNTLFLPATSSINSYINIHSVEVYGERGKKAKLATLTVGETAELDGNKVSYSVSGTAGETSATLTYTKAADMNVTLAISDVQTTKATAPNELTDWNSTIPASLAIPATPGSTYYYYLRSELADHQTMYYEIEIMRRNTADVVYNYDLTINPITSEEDPTLQNITNTAGYHSSHGWRFNYGSGSTLQVKVEGDAIIKLRGCAYNGDGPKITATVDNQSMGKITPLSEVTAINNCQGYNNFYYAGQANTITFTYTGVAFLSYITIINEGTGEADLRAIFVGETELSLNSFADGAYTLDNIGYLDNPTPDAFPKLNFAMKNGLNEPTVTGELVSGELKYTYTFAFNGTNYQIHIPYEAEMGYAVNEAEQRYDISTSYGLKTVIAMLNSGTASYKAIYLSDGTYFLGDVDGSYQHGISLSADGVTLIGESHEARITGKYYGVTSSVVELKGANTIVRNLTIESLVGDNGVGPALSTGADNILFDNVQIIGWQDTYVGGNGRHLFYKCIIAGSVDFICNGATAMDYFLLCELQLQYRKNGGYITAPQGETYFRGCRVTNVLTNITSMDRNFSLGRPWRETGKAFFINTTFDIVPNYGFVMMSSNIFPNGSCGSVGNIKEADGSPLTFVNDANTPNYTMTETDIATYSSIEGMCGSWLASLIEDDPVGIDTIDKDVKKGISIINGEIALEGIKCGASICIYGINGTLLESIVTDSDNPVIPFRFGKGIYIVKVDEYSCKVVY